MKKHVLLLILSIFFLKGQAQISTINYDYWQTVSTYSVSNTPYQDFNKSVMVENKLMMIIDTFSGNNPYSRKGILEYNTITRNISPLAYPIQDGDRGIQCATAYKTSTPGLTYGIFGCYSGSNVGDNYPVFYTYNSLTSTFTSDSINLGVSSDFEGGITHIAMFSPTTNHDTIRFFAKMNIGTQVFKKHINQPSIVPTFASIGIEYIKASIVYNNKLYVAGDSTISDYALLKESIDGNTFTQPNNINNLSFPYTARVALLDTLDGKLIIGLNLNGGSLGYEIYSYDGTTLQLLSSDAIGTITSSQNFKKRLWYSTNVFDNGSTANYAYLHSISNGVSIPSVQAFGGNAIDGKYMNLAATEDSLYFAGNKGTLLPSIIINGNNNAEQRHLALIDRYLEVHKLMPPVSSFNYNNNQICLNTNATFTSTSQNVDSLRWIKDADYYYAASPGGSAWMNYNFSTAGTHTVGLIAFGGTLSDTTFLSINAYSITAAVSGQTLVCLGNSFVMTSTVTGAVGTPTLGWRDYITSPSADLSTNSTLTYSPITGGTAYQFYLNVIDVHGCTAISNTLFSQANPLQHIQGNAFEGANPAPGDVTIYKYESFLGKFDSIRTEPVNGIGQFLFTSMPEGDYIIKATPTATNLQTSYTGTNAVGWKSAVPFNHTCLTQPVININVIPLDDIGTGPGKLSGMIKKGVGFVDRHGDEFKPYAPGEPIGGIVVKGGKNPGGQMFTQTKTDATGQYTLTGLPLNTIGVDEYFILVDIPGLDTNGTYHRVITAGNTEIGNLDFEVDGTHIYPLGSATLIHSDNMILDNKISVYPNPAKNVTTIQYELLKSAHVTVEIYDVIGKKIKTLIQNSSQEKNKINHRLQLDEFSSGIYFIKLKINESETSIKLLITN